ncbi:hypothetical protein M0805_002935 [Coniferiporia weirii]|nr:hypothetical protein M0805_002935 [Coniferiporia weirii]
MSVQSDAPSDGNVAKRNLVRTFLSENGDKGWDKAWKENVTPWDHGEIQPSLIEALDSSVFKLPTKGRALVPGCGRGYDTIFIASRLDYDVVGVDLSPSAVDAAKIYLEQNIPPVNNVHKQVSFLATDFFEFTVGEGENFDLVFDHTFFCAIPPSLRKAWGQQMTKLAKPGGFLITLVYPIDGSREGGPPFSVTVECYEQALPQWEKVLDKVSYKSSPSHEGRERLVVWRRNFM